MSKEKPLIHNKRRNKIRLHHEGKHSLLYAGLLGAFIICLAWFAKDSLSWGSYIIIAIVLVVYGILLNYLNLCKGRVFSPKTQTKTELFRIFPQNFLGNPK